MYRRDVGLCPVEVPEFRCFDPADLGVFMQHELTASWTGKVDLEVDVFVAVLGVTVGQEVADFDVKAKFFAGLAYEGLLGCLASVDLSSGEFPLQREWHGGRALGDEAAVFAVDGRSYNRKLFDPYSLLLGRVAPHFGGMDLIGGLEMWFTRIRHRVVEHYVWLMAAVAVVLIGLVVRFPQQLRDPELLLPLLASFLSIVFFLQKQRLEELRLFREIFRDCNERYDQLNEEISKIRERPPGESLEPREKQVLTDYFNLCGEEYLYFRQGYIYPRVWDAWEAGMKDHLCSPRIEPFWLKEKRSGSYYGIPV